MRYRRIMAGIFLSYARDDDEPFVRQLHDDLTTRGIAVWWDRNAMESRGRTFLQEIRDAIAAVERVVLVIGPSAVRSDYVKAEWQFALEACKVVIPILRLGESSLVPGELSRLDYLLVPDPLSKFHCPDFRGGRPYDQALDELVRILGKELPPLAGLSRVDALPAHYLPREEDIEQLNRMVLADVQRATVITSARRATALQGMGGVGKSVLAAAFARACRTRRAFGDGVIWLKFGQQPNLVRNMAVVGEALRDSRGNYRDPESASARLAEVLAGKNCLLVLDDVWDVTHTRAFLNALDTRCRLLITTRDGGLVTAMEAQEHRVAILSDEQALHLLARWADQDARELPADARAAAAECGNLPLALAMIGAMVSKDPTRWANALHKLRNADLELIQQQFPNYPYPDLLRAMQVSVDALAPEVQRRYLDFAVFPEDTPVPEAAVAVFWAGAGVDAYKTQDIVDLLVRRSLLQRDESHRLGAHDLQHDYVRKQAADLPALHARLLDAYAARCPEGWASGPDDGYFFEHLVYHLAQAGRRDALYVLIDRAWMAAQFKRTYSYLQFADDVELAIVQAGSEHPPNVTQEIRGRLIGASLGSISSNVPVAALGTLAHLGQGSKALRLAETHEERSQGLRLVGLALLERNEPAKARDLLLDVLETEQRSTDPNISLLAGIAVGLARLGELDRVLAVAAAVSEPDRKGRLLCWIPLLLAQAGLRQQALETVQRGHAAAAGMQDTPRRAEALSRVAQAMALAGLHAVSRETASQAWDIARTIEDAEGRCQALGEVACALALAGEGAAATEVAEHALGFKSYGEGCDRVAYALVWADRPERAFELCTKSLEAIAGAAEALLHRRDVDGLRRLLALVRNGPERRQLGRVAQALARIGDKATAAEAVREAWAETDRQGSNQSVHYLCELSFALALAGELAAASTVMDRILASSHADEPARFFFGRFEAVKALAESLVQSGAKHEAIAFVRGIARDGLEHVRLVAGLALRLAEHGDLPLARELSEQILPVAGSIEDPSKRNSALSSAIEALVRVGNLDRAREAILSLDDAQQEGNAWMLLAQAWSRADRMDLADDLARNALACCGVIEGAPGWKVDIVQKTLEIRHPLEAPDILTGVLDLLRSLDDASSRDEGYCVVVEALTRNGAFEQALQVALLVTDETPVSDQTRRAQALAIVAEGLAKTGPPEPAVALAVHAVDDCGRSIVLGRVALQLARGGALAKAVELARQALVLAEAVESEYRRTIALATAIQPLALAGDLGAVDRALRLARGIANPQWRQAHLGPAVSCLVSLGDFDRAASLVDSFDESGARHVLTDLIPSLIGTGDLLKAMSLLDRIEYLPWKVEAVEAISRALVQAGDVPGALGLAQQSLAAVEDSGVDSAGRADALGRIARLLTSLGQAGPALTAWRSAFKRPFRGEPYHSGRERLFETLRYGAPFLAALDRGKTLTRICQAVRDVEEWWSP